MYNITEQIIKYYSYKMGINAYTTYRKIYILCYRQFYFDVIVSFMNLDDIVWIYFNSMHAAYI